MNINPFSKVVQTEGRDFVLGANNSVPGVIELVRDIAQRGIPSSGVSDNPLLEMHRILDNLSYDWYNNGGGNEIRWLSFEHSVNGGDEISNHVRFRNALKESSLDKDAKKIINQHYMDLKKVTGKYGKSNKCEEEDFENMLALLRDNVSYYVAKEMHPKEVRLLEVQLANAQKEGVVLKEKGCKASVFIGNGVEDSTVSLQIKGGAEKGIKAYQRAEDIRNLTHKVMLFLGQSQTQNSSLLEQYKNVRSFEKDHNKDNSINAYGFFKDKAEGNFHLNNEYGLFDKNGRSEGVQINAVNTGGTDKKPDLNDIEINFYISSETTKFGLNKIEHIIQLHDISRKIVNAFNNSFDNVKELSAEAREVSKKRTSEFSFTN